MRKIKDILRFRHEAGFLYRGIANALNIGYGTVVDYLNRAQRARPGAALLLRFPRRPPPRWPRLPACLRRAAMLCSVCKNQPNQLVKYRPQARARRPAGSLWHTQSWVCIFPG